jgi:hypothetical protein
MFVDFDIEQDTGYRLFDWHGTVDLLAHEVVLVFQLPKDFSMFDVFWPDVLGHDSNWVRNWVVSEGSSVFSDFEINVDQVSEVAKIADFWVSKDHRTFDDQNLRVFLVQLDGLI